MSDKYFFSPRIGSRYDQGFMKLRTLVTGVTHICTLDCKYHDICRNQDTVANMDRECPVYKGKDQYYSLSNSNRIEIDSFIEGSARYPAYSIFTYYMTKGKDTLLPSVKEEFWESVAFTNFLQCFLDNDELDGLHDSDLDKAYDAFKQVCEEVNPQVIFVWNPVIRNYLQDKSDLFRYAGMADMTFGLSVYIFIYRLKESEIKESTLRKFKYRFHVIPPKHNKAWYRDLVSINLGHCIIIPPQKSVARKVTKEDVVRKIAGYLQTLVADGFLGTYEDSLCFADSDRFKWTTNHIGVFIKNLKDKCNLGTGANEGLARIFNKKDMEKYKTDSKLLKNDELNIVCNIDYITDKR